MRNNVTEVYFNGQEMTAILVHWQHDYKQILKFADLDLPFSYEVDFANAGDNQSKTMLGNADGVEIPDEYLMTGKAINAYIYLHDASDSGETVRKVSIQVHGRPERTEEIPDQHQQSLIEQAIATLDAAVEQTASDVQTTGEYKEEAHGYADEAKGYAERAESAESEVEGYATRAETAESHAQGYAQTASDKASEASGYASEAKGYSESASSFASDAQASSEASYLSAQSSSRYASDASGYASSAYDSAQNASGSASDASSAKDLAVQAKDDAISAKNDAVSAKNDAETAKGKAEDAQEIAERAAGSVLGLTADATVDSNTGTPSVEVDVSTVSDHKNMSFSFHNLNGIPGTPGQDGFSPTITVTEITGGHEVEVVDAQGTQTFDVMDGQSGLITDYVAEEKTPYLFRPSASGLANVISEKDELIGGTVAWNQLIQNGNFTDSTGWSKVSTVNLSVSDNVATLSLNTNPSQQYHTAIIKSSISFEYNHKILTFATVKLPKSGSFKMDSNSSLYPNTKTWGNIQANTWTTVSHIFTGENNGAKNIYWFPLAITDGYAQGDSWQIKDICIYDLTQMFGSTIADYIYSLEQANAGDGVAWLKRLFPKDYYPYNSGDLLSVQTSAHVMRDANDNVIGNYPLDSSLVLRGTLKLDANNNLVYDGDVYKCDGSVQRRYGIVDLGTLTWKSRTFGIDQNIGFWAQNQIPGVAVTGVLGKANAICAKYPIVINGGVGISTNDKVMAVGAYYANGCNVYLVDSAYSGYTGDQVKSALSGVYLVYELDTPTSETADPYSEYQIVSADGTEEYVDERTVPIPVGHDTYYQQAVDVPQLPTTDGAYRLALSKTGNTATASWEYVAQAEMKAQTNIPSGKYFSVGERLFVSTQAIAQGANIVVGTNCTETTLADALNTINS